MLTVYHASFFRSTQQAARYQPGGNEKTQHTKQNDKHNKRYGELKEKSDKKKDGFIKRVGETLKKMRKIM